MVQLWKRLNWWTMATVKSKCEVYTIVKHSAQCRTCFLQVSSVTENWTYTHKEEYDRRHNFSGSNLNLCSRVSTRCENCGYSAPLPYDDGRTCPSQPSWHHRDRLPRGSQEKVQLPPQNTARCYEQVPGAFFRQVNDMDTLLAVDTTAGTITSLEAANDRDSLAQNWDHALIMMAMERALITEPVTLRTIHLNQVQDGWKSHAAAKKNQ